MKQLLIYIDSTSLSFDEETATLVKVQIDNSIEIGWDLEDILLVTNFDYEYRGVQSIKVSSDLFCWHCPISTKVYVINHLFGSGFFNKREIYWYHDFDAYESDKIKEAEVCLDGCSLGLTAYRRSARWSTSSFFFKGDSGLVFKLWQDVMDYFKADDERSLTFLTRIGNKVGKINTTYNLQMLNIRNCYWEAVKPVKVLHFHPDVVNRHIGANTTDFFIRGKNKLNVTFVSDRLARIFEKHGIK